MKQRKCSKSTIKASVYISIIMVLIMLPQSVFAASWYAGTNKSGSQTGIAAQIKTPTKLPTLGSSGESCWVSNVYTPSGGTKTWVQTGIRYYSGYSGFKTYVETQLAGGYNMQDIGVHALNISIHYNQ